MFAKVKSLGIFGMDAFSVVVEADISPVSYTHLTL